ncbi:hypothetical protein BDV59DRAFT_179055 [Aspergillus ambiguus]|uniref:uncharacterized protein n=1 Tax=Aspergillus ambiguus TaxID=176160 RepID=UPI003CCD7CF9
MSTKVNIAELEGKMDDLIITFCAHPSFENRTFAFLADFVRNSRLALGRVDKAKYAAGDARACIEVKEVMGRNNFAKMLMNDTSGKLSAVTGGEPVDFGDEIRAKMATVC